MATLTLNPAAVEARRRARPAPPPQTQPADTNKATKRKADLDAIEARLKLIWPHCFGDAPVPLAIGIRWDIAKHLNGDEAKLLPGVLHRWVKRPKYLRACAAPGSQRIGLDGSRVPVSERERAYAASKCGGAAPVRQHL